MRFTYFSWGMLGGFVLGLWTSRLMNTPLEYSTMFIIVVVIAVLGAFVSEKVTNYFNRHWN